GRKETDHGAVKSETATAPTAFDFYAIPGSQRAAVLADRIFTDWLTFRAFKRPPTAERLGEYRRIIEGITANLLYAKATHRSAVRTSREKATFAKKSRYRPDAFNERFLHVLDDLHNMGVIHLTLGERWKGNPFSGKPVQKPYL